MNDRRFALLLMLPAAAFLAVFVLLASRPLRLRTDCSSSSPLRGCTPRIRRLRELRAAFASEAFQKRRRAHVVYTLIVVIAEFTLGLAVALLFTALGHRSAVFRTIFILPLMIAPVVAGLLWRFLLIDNFGIVNELLYRAHILASPDQIQWLSDPEHRAVRRRAAGYLVDDPHSSRSCSSPVCRTFRARSSKLPVSTARATRDSCSASSSRCFDP